MHFYDGRGGMQDADVALFLGRKKDSIRTTDSFSEEAINTMSMARHSVAITVFDDASCLSVRVHEWNAAMFIL